MTAATDLVLSVAALLEEPDPDQRLKRFARLVAETLGVPFAAVVAGRAGDDAVAVAARDDAMPPATTAALTAWLQGSWLRTVDLPPGAVRPLAGLATAETGVSEALAATDLETVFVAALPVGSVSGWLIAGGPQARADDLGAQVATLARLAAPLLRGGPPPAEDSLAALVDALPDPVEVYDRDGRLARVNRRHAAVFGTDRVRPGMTEEGVAAALRAVFAKPELLADAARRHGQPPVELETLGPEPLTFERSSAAVAAGNVASSVVVYRDVTRLKRTEKQKDDFLSFASHELKTPLTTIKGYSQMLQRRLHNAASDPERRAAFDMEKAALEADQVREEGDRMNRLVDQLLDVSRVQTGRLTISRQPLDLRVLVHETIEKLRMAMDGRTIRYVAPRERGALVVDADVDRLKQVLGNLIENAVRYSPPDSPVEVRLRPATAADGRRTAVLSVRDRGLGIEKADLDLIFDQFYRAQRQAAVRPLGMGLGLFITREIVRQHGGRVWAESAGRGRGATFCVELPLHGPDR